MNNHDERRVKIVSVNPDLIVTLLNWCANPLGFYALPVTADIPAGSQVLSVFPNHRSRTIELEVYHESFAPVHPGAMPDIVGHWDEKLFKREEIDDQFRVISLIRDLRDQLDAQPSNSGDAWRKSEELIARADAELNRETKS